MTTFENFNLAAIDVGSNAARLLIKDVKLDIDGTPKLSKRLFLRIPLRLGMDVFGDGKLSDKRSEEFLRTMKAYKLLMKVYHVKAYRACATSAMRDAKNGKDVLKEIEKKTNMKLEIISGDEESQIVYDNHLAQLDPNKDYLYVDVGGGSTEVSFLKHGERCFSHSYDIGTIRLLNDKVKREDFEKMTHELQEITQQADQITIVGSGGNINKLYRIASKRDKQVDKLPVETLRRLHARLSKMSLEERMDVFGLKPDRADVIVPAAEIFLEIANSIHSTTIMVPNVGLADGILNDLLTTYMRKKKD